MRIFIFLIFFNSASLFISGKTILSKYRMHSTHYYRIVSTIHTICWLGCVPGNAELKGSFKETLFHVQQFIPKEHMF
uniref:Secreted protein n=1 Tax=Manihot esculenta TaxID=3983 RepID=A0A2C9V7T2_MANES